MPNPNTPDAPAFYPRVCPLCGYEGQFIPFGKPPRTDAQCPKCRSLERHRLFWLWFEENRDLVTGPFLHFAPEKCLVPKFRERYADYKTADLFSDADLKLDLQQINQPSGHYQTILCNHVLEHIDDDRQAMRELHRVLADTGLLIVSVPIVYGWESTYENKSITDPFLREIHFGQFDHVRYYGHDFIDRLRESGFTRIEEVTAQGEDIIKYALMRGEKFFVCRK